GASGALTTPRSPRLLRRDAPGNDDIFWCDRERGDAISSGWREAGRLSTIPLLPPLPCIFSSSAEAGWAPIFDRLSREPLRWARPFAGLFNLRMGFCVRLAIDMQTGEASIRLVIV